MTDKPNPDDFSVNERKGEYSVTFSVSSEVRLEFQAENADDARRQAEAMTDEDLIDYIDELDDVEIESVWTLPKMYRVTRDGRPIQVSYLKAGDLPREPDERGF